MLSAFSLSAFFAVSLAGSGDPRKLELGYTTPAPIAQNQPFESCIQSELKNKPWIEAFVSRAPIAESINAKAYPRYFRVFDSDIHVDGYKWAVAYSQNRSLMFIVRYQGLGGGYKIFGPFSTFASCRKA